MLSITFIDLANLVDSHLVDHGVYRTTTAGEDIVVNVFAVFHAGTSFLGSFAGNVLESAFLAEFPNQFTKVSSI